MILRLVIAAALTAPMASTASGEPLPVNPRYGRASLDYQIPAIAQALSQSPDQSPWRVRVAQDLSVFIGADTFGYQLLARTRFKPGYDCLVATAGETAAKQWVDKVLKAHMREKQDMDRMNAATTATEKFAPGPAEDCNKPPALLGSKPAIKGS